jgi:hypothetical protein
MIEIQTGDDLFKIEKEITHVNTAPEGAEFTIRLARNLNAHFFKQSWVAALFATAAQKGSAILRDWHHTWTPEDVDVVFRSSIAHFAAAIYANQISNERGVPSPFEVQELAVAVAHNGGVLEPHSLERKEIVGNALSFCSIDPDFGEPLTLAGLIYNKKRFVDELTTIKRRDLDRDKFYTTPDLFGDYSPDRELAGYVFELYQNGYEHGNRNRIDKKILIPGLRFVSFRKHVAVNNEQILAYANGFQELGNFIRKHYDNHQTLKYYEVSVSDQGIGMLDRFLIDRPEFVSEAKDRASRLSLLKRLLKESLTSKKLAPGAGGGLIRALRAAKELKGFISIRTGEFWLICSFAGRGADPIELTEVENFGGSIVAGTHFNALFPLRR